MDCDNSFVISDKVWQWKSTKQWVLPNNWRPVCTRYRLSQYVRRRLSQAFSETNELPLTCLGAHPRVAARQTPNLKKVRGRLSMRRPIWVVLLIVGMVAVSEMAFANSVRTPDLGPFVSMGYPAWIESSLTLPAADQVLSFGFICCNGAVGVTDLEVTFSANLLLGTAFLSTLPGCVVGGLGTMTASFTCAGGIPVGQRIALIAVLPPGAKLTGACWTGPGGGACIGPATLIPEPPTLVLLASGLLSLSWGARRVGQKLRV
jgi:hypothetical protein